MARTQPKRPNIVLLTLDCVRPDHLGCYGYHRNAISRHIDSIARRGVVFPRVVCQSCFTGYSHASILTGLYPFEHGYHHNLGRMSEGIHSLVEDLEAAGYRTGAFIGVEFLGREQGFAAGFDQFDDDFSDFLWRNEKLGGARVGRDWWPAARRWLGDVAAGDRPFFMWGHWFNTHQGVFPRQGGGLRARWLRFRFPPDDKLPDGYACYDAQIAHCDRYLVNGVLRVLRGQGALGNTIIAITSDHGQALGHHGFIGHDNLHSRTIQVPLVMAGPGVCERWTDAVPRLARSLDILPMCMEAAGVEMPWPHRAEWDSEGARLAYSYGVSVDLEDEENNVYLEAVQDREWKLIHHGKETLLYSVRDDPEEEHDLASQRRDAVERLQAALEKLKGGFSYREQHLSKQWAGSCDEGLLSRLRDLGYL